MPDELSICVYRGKINQIDNMDGKITKEEIR